MLIYLSVINSWYEICEAEPSPTTFKVLGIAKITGKRATCNALGGVEAWCDDGELFDGSLAHRKRKKRIKLISAVNHQVLGEAAGKQTSGAGLFLESARYHGAHASSVDELAGGCAFEV